MKNGKLDEQISILILTLLFAGTVLVLPYSVSDPINLPKMLVLVIAASVLVSLLLSNIREVATKARMPILIVSVLFVLDLILLLSNSGVWFSENLYGTAGRNTGVVTYISFTIVCVASAVVANDRVISRILGLFWIIGVFLIIYGNLQNLGLEPFPYISIYESKVIGTFGNPNFQSSFMGMLAVLASTNILKSTLGLFKRVGFILLLCFSLLSVYQTKSIQGFFNFVLGFGVVIFFYFVSSKRKILSRITGFALLLGISVIIGSFLKVGPLADLIYKGSMSARVYYWKSAIKIAMDHPYLGIGMDQYGDWLRVYRTSEEVATNLTADSAHNIYLDVLAGGGFPLFMIFTSFTLLTTISIIRVMRRAKLPQGNYFALVGLWVAYQAQALISISQIGVAVWGWVFSGLLIGYEINTRNNFNIQGDLKSKGKLGKKQETFIPMKTIIATSVGLSIGLLITLPPFISAQNYYNAFKSSDARVIKAAAFLTPYNRNSFLQVTGILMTNNFSKDALEVAREGVIHFPNSFTLWKAVADLSAKGSTEHSDAIKRLHTLDPNNPAYVLP